MKNCIAELRKKINPEFRGYEIISEINELLIDYAPENLNKDSPDLKDLDQIYQLLKVLTNISIKNNIEDAKLFYENLRRETKKSYNIIYLKYLEDVINEN